MSRVNRCDCCQRFVNGLRAIEYQLGHGDTDIWYLCLLCHKLRCGPGNVHCRKSKPIVPLSQQFRKPTP